MQDIGAHRLFTKDQFTGCFIGLATGDALGAPHEGGILERCIWRLIGTTRDGKVRWTDDTQMALDLADSLLAQLGLVEADLALRFAQGYAWSRGYGPGTARLLKKIRGGQDWQSASTSIFPGGSYGNGAAMRSPILALYFCDDFPKLIACARASAKVTHSHPLGVEGGVLIAVATYQLLCRHSVEQVLAAVLAQCAQPDMRTRVDVARRWLVEDKAGPAPREVAKRLGNGMTAATSAVTAIYIGLRHIDHGFMEMMEFVISCGGDVDTIGAMAGALWGAFNGTAGLPDVLLEKRDVIVDSAERLFVAGRSHHHDQRRSSEHMTSSRREGERGCAHLTILSVAPTRPDNPAYFEACLPAVLFFAFAE